jgi:hypothetical protein
MRRALLHLATLVRVHVREWKLMVLVGTTVIALGAPLRAQDGKPSGTFDPKTGRFGRTFGALQRAPDSLAVASGRVWAALVVVYSELDIPLSVADSTTHVIGAVYLSRRRPVGGQRLSRILACGDGTFGPNADHYEVQLTALSAVVPPTRRIPRSPSPSPGWRRSTGTTRPSRAARRAGSRRGSSTRSRRSPGARTRVGQAGSPPCSSPFLYDLRGPVLALATPPRREMFAGPRCGELPLNCPLREPE